MHIATVRYGGSAYKMESVAGAKTGKKPERTIGWPVGCKIVASARSDGPDTSLCASPLFTMLPSPVVQTSGVKDIVSCCLGFSGF